MLFVQAHIEVVCFRVALPYCMHGIPLLYRGAYDRLLSDRLVEISFHPEPVRVRRVRVHHAFRFDTKVVEIPFGVFYLIFVIHRSSLAQGVTNFKLKHHQVPSKNGLKS